MIIIFTSNTEGGILQYALRLLRELSALGQECRLFLPQNAKVSKEEELQHLCVPYEKVKTLCSDSPKIHGIANQILAYEPKLVWFVESAIVSSQVCFALRGKAPRYITIHDPAADHPTYHLTLRERMKRCLRNHLQTKCMKSVEKILLPSKESEIKYQSYEPWNKEKTLTFPLGSISPKAEPFCPKELEEDAKTRFYLFFGRIDKYKGIDTLLKAYAALPEPKAPLVIAGKGTFSPEEQELIERQPQVLALSRYIEDGEMLWLFQQAIGVVLPYKEASQSGILPIAYEMGIPVLVSKEKGLAQYVVEGETGYICEDVPAFQSSMQKILEKSQAQWKKNCQEYYKKNLDSQSFLEQVIRELP